MKMILNIEPKPQTRPRFSKFGTYEDPKMKAWRRQCSQLIEQEYDGQFFDGPIMVDVTFYMKAPLSVSQRLVSTKLTRRVSCGRMTVSFAI